MMNMKKGERLMKIKGKSLKLAVAAMIIILSAMLVCVVVIASGSRIETDASYSQVNASAAGNISLNFYYTDLGSAEKMVTEITAPDGTVQKKEIARANVAFNAETKLYCVKVPIAPSQMSYSVKVYAEDSNGIGKVKEYSVLKYAQDVLAESSLSEYHQAMRMLLNWGAMAETLFDDGGEISVNADLYTRGTNPIDGVKSFYSEVGTVTPSTNIVGKNFAMSLEPGSTVMNFYVNYTGDGKLSATVSKNGGAATATSIAYVGKDGEADTYCVSIKNVGAVVYNTPYTVTVTDGTETFTATKTALEYLNTLASATDENAKYNDIAKSMYQFYTVISNKIDASCTHDGDIHMSVDGAYEYMTCSECFEHISDRRIDKNIPWFTNPEEMYAFSNQTQAFEKGELLYDNGMPFTRRTISSDGNANAVNEVHLTYNKAGAHIPDKAQYVVVRYRMSSTDTAISLRAKFSDDSGKVVVLGNQNQSATIQNTWTTAVVDISAALSQYPDATAYDIYLRIESKTTAEKTLDIAYFAFADSMEQARSIMLADETFRVGGFATLASAPIYNSQLCASHTFARSAKDNGDGTTTYKYVCSGCGLMSNEHTVPASLLFYSELVRVDRRSSSGNLTDAAKEYVTVNESGIAYAHSGNNTAELFTHVTRDSRSTVIPSLTYGNEAFFVMKYRLRENPNVGDVNEIFRIQLNSTYKPFFNFRSDEWQTIVIDIAAYGFKNTTANADFAIRHFGDLDIAYTAIASSITEVQALLADGETYMMCSDADNDNYLDAAEYNKNGTPVNGGGEAEDPTSVIALNKDLEGMITDKATGELQLLAFTDVHTGLYAWNRIVDYYNEYSSHIDFAIHLGDYAGKDLGVFTDLYGTGTVSTKPIFNIVGNHDTMPSGTETISGAPKADVFSKLFATSGTWGVKFMDGENSMAYYVDYADKNIRFIVLDNYYDQDAQVEWLKNLLAEAKAEGMHVLTAMHQPSGAIVRPANTHFHTTLPTTGFEYSPFDAVIGDFIKDGGKFIANLAGHWHIDLFGYTENGVLNIAIETASPENVPANQLDGRTQEQGTRGYDAFDVININATDGIFELVRIGNNIDSANRTKTSLKYDYVNGKILLENGEEKSDECETCMIRSTVTDNGDGTTTYAYVCAVCGKELANSHTVPSSLLFYSDLLGIQRRSASDYLGGQSVKVENGLAYVSSPADSTAEIYTCVTRTTSGVPDVTLGKYFVMKYRVQNYSGDFKQQSNVGSGFENANKSAISNRSSDWQIIVVDISSMVGYNEGVAQSLDIQIRHLGDLDVAYAALAANMDDVRALLLDGETYFYLGTSFANAGTEYAKNEKVEGEDNNATEETTDNPFFYEAQEIVDNAGKNAYTAVSVETEDTVTYAHFTRADGTTNGPGFWFNYDSSYGNTGKYLVFKYRTNVTTDWLAYYTSTSSSTANNSTMGWTTLNGDGNWHVFIVDADLASTAFEPDGDGNYFAQFLQISLFYNSTNANDYMDFAYIGWAETEDEAFGYTEVGDDISYGYYNGADWEPLSDLESAA